MKYYENIMKKVPEYEYKRGIQYTKPDDTFFKRFRIFYAIVLIFCLGINTMVISGIYMYKWDYAYGKSVFYSVLACSIMLIAAFVLTFFKNKVYISVLSSVINILSAVGLIITLLKPLADEVGGYQSSFYWLHLIPLCILVLCGIVLTAITIRADIKKKKTYKKIVENLYNQHRKSIQDGVMVDSDWEEFLKNYE